jgi:hypothetical protein
LCCIVASDDYVLVGDDKLNVDVLDKTTLKPVAKLDIFRRKMTGGLVVKNKAFICAAAGQEIFVFNLKDFTLIKTIQVTKCPSYIMKYSENIILVCEIFNIELINSDSNQVVHTFSNPDATRFLYASKTSRPNEVVLGSEKGVFFV